MNTLELAEYVSFRAHMGQKDKSGKDYYLHPKTVASMVEDETDKICAYLHDVMEDTEFSEKSLRILFGDEIVDTLCLLTHDDGLSYDEYIERLSGSKRAIRVKLADLAHNSDLSRLSTVTEKDLQRLEKYKRAAAYLRSKLND